jgi:hypothetical protein
VLRDLRRGRWSIQDHIDLHGMNRHEAHEQVALFSPRRSASGRRCLRIVHGRGHGSPGREAILRQLVKVWLGRCKDVLAFCHAPPCDGGDGALWVLLKAAASKAAGRPGERRASWSIRVAVPRAGVRRLEVAQIADSSSSPVRMRTTCSTC